MGLPKGPAPCKSVAVGGRREQALIVFVFAMSRIAVTRAFERRQYLLRVALIEFDAMPLGSVDGIGCLSQRLGGVLAV